MTHIPMSGPQVEQQMRSDVENKKQQLRLLVGDSYR